MFGFCGSIGQVGSAAARVHVQRLWSTSCRHRWCGTRRAPDCRRTAVPSPPRARCRDASGGSGCAQCARSSRAPSWSTSRRRRWSCRRHHRSRRCCAPTSRPRPPTRSWDPSRRPGSRRCSSRTCRTPEPKWCRCPSNATRRRRRCRPRACCARPKRRRCMRCGRSSRPGRARARAGPRTCRSRASSCRWSSWGPILGPARESPPTLRRTRAGRARPAGAPRLTGPSSSCSWSPSCRSSWRRRHSWWCRPWRRSSPPWPRPCSNRGHPGTRSGCRPSARSARSW